MEGSQESKGWSRRSTIAREEESGLRQANGDGPQSLCFCKLGSEAALCRWLRRKTTIALIWDCGVLEGFSASGCFVLPWTSKSLGKTSNSIQKICKISRGGTSNSIREKWSFEKEKKRDGIQCSRNSIVVVFTVECQTLRSLAHTRREILLD